MSKKLHKDSLLKNKKNICVLIVLFMVSLCSAQESLDSALNNLTDQISKYIVEQKKAKIAIIPFQDIQRQAVTVLANFIAEELTTNLFATGKFNIVERSLLKQVVDELKLSQTGILDPSSAKEFGKMTGVDAIIAGTIVNLGVIIAINCRLIETQTGEVFAVAKARANIDKNIKKLIDGDIIEKQINVDKKRTEKKPEQEGITDSISYDLGNYSMDGIRDRFGNSGYINFISVTIKKDVTAIKMFLASSTNWPNQGLVFKWPTLIDDLGNEYDFIRARGQLENGPYDKIEHMVRLPGNTKRAIIFEFHPVERNANKVYFSFCNRQIEFDWQEILNKEIR